MASLARPIAAPAPPRWSPRRFWRRMTPAEGWSSVLLLAIIMLATAWTVARTEVAPDLLSMAALALGGLVVGLILAKAGVPDLLAHVLALLGGLTASVLVAIERMPFTSGGRMAQGEALARLASEWLAQAQAGAQLNDPRLLAILLGAAVWLVAYTSTWVLFRRGWLTVALGLPAVIAVANLGYSPHQGTLPLLVLVSAATLLTARHAAYRRQVEWSRLRLPYPRQTISRFLLGGLAIALLVGVLSWTLPVSARENLLGDAWDQISEPLTSASDRVNEMLGQLLGRREEGGGSYSAFGESFRLGGHLNLSDDPVMLLDPSSKLTRPAYLAGQRYDSFSGFGWTTTVDDTFDAIGENGQRYSSRLSFNTGQGLHLSPEVTTNRSEIQADLSVIRPKGDLMFSVDTYFTANRKTNVQVSWQQLQNQPFPLADPTALPLDLQRIGVLVSRGVYPPTVGDAAADAPLPEDDVLAADVQAERDYLRTRFLNVSWQVGEDGRAHTLVVSGQLPVYDDAEAVFSQAPIAQGDTYDVKGLASIASPEKLRAASTAYPAWVTDRYLQLPDTITDRTRQLSTELVADAATPFDAATAVETYVRETITYREDIDAPPAGQDVVDYVLFESREGYCEYYASAMAVLLRAQDIPTRVVGGYYPAPFDDAAEGYLYREKNAHLWVEVFFPGYGWIPFEPTANRDLLSYGDVAAAQPDEVVPTPAPTPEAQVVQPTPAPQPEQPEETPPPPTQPTDFLMNPGRFAGWIGLALFALLAVGGIAATSLWFAGLRGLSPISSLYARALRAGEWLGVRPTPAMTPNEYATRMGQMIPSAQGPARIVADLYAQEHYAAQRPDSGQTQRARAAWRQLRGIALGGLLHRNRRGRQR